MAERQDDNGRVGGGVSFEAGPHPKTFFEEIAKERQQRREFRARLEPGDVMLEVMAGIPQRPQENSETEHQAFGLLPGEKRAGSNSRADGLAAAEGPQPPAPAFGFGGRLTGETKRFGLNAVKAYQAAYVGGVCEPTKFGTDSRPFGDCENLMCQVVRQHSGRDLIWGNMAPVSGSSNFKGYTGALDFLQGMPVPLESGLPSALDDGLDPNNPPDYESSNHNMWLQLLMQASNYSQRVVYTFLTLGGGDDRTPPDTFDSSACATSCATYSDGSSQLEPTDNQVPINWDDGHIGQTSPKGGFCFPTGCDWHLSSLDPACPYKREYIGLIAEEVASKLSGLQNALSMQGYSLTEIVEAVEIFNEVDLRDRWTSGTDAYGDLIYDMGPCGEDWGRAFLHAAWYFRRQLPDEISIKLPGISSYGEGSGYGWDDKKAFIESLIIGMVAEANEHWDALTGAADAADVLQTIPSLVQGIDLHWYHRSVTTRGDERLHIGYLVHEVEEVQQTVKTSMVNSLPVGYVTEEDYEDFPVTVFENGYSQEDPPPAGVSAEEFQAYEVWRRLGGALASPATVAGWHSWMSASSAFGKMGLREDTHSSTDPASDAVPRPAWYAFACLATLLQNRVISGSMVLPASTSRSDLENMLSSVTAGTDPWIVVFEYQLQAGSATSNLDGAYFGKQSCLDAFRWAYMVLRDHTSTWGGGLSVLARKADKRASYDVCRLGPVPTIIQATSSGSDYALPERRGTYFPAQVTSFPHLCTPGYQPWLYLSTARLDWSLTRLGTSSQAGAVHMLCRDAVSMHKPPPWFDDPNLPWKD